MATYEELVKANALIKTTDVKGKEYAEVSQRVKAFRSLYPEGCIMTEILSNENGVVVMQATCYSDNEHVLSTGLAYEKEGSSYINKTSYIENCETSAVGRALGFAGFGIDTSIASAEEVMNAQLNQTGYEQIGDKEAATMKKLLQATDSDVTAFLKMINDHFGRGVGSVDELNKREHAFGLMMLKKKADRAEKGDK